MKIEIKLKNIKICNGCPLYDEEMCNCNLGYYLTKFTEYNSGEKIIRPKDCIKDNGE